MDVQTELARARHVVHAPVRISMRRQRGGRVAANEVMIGTPAIRNLIREDKVAQMYSAIQTGANHGMQTMDQCLRRLVQQKIINREAAREKAKIPEDFA